MDLALNNLQNPTNQQPAHMFTVICIDTNICTYVSLCTTMPQQQYQTIWSPLENRSTPHILI